MVVERRPDAHTGRTGSPSRDRRGVAVRREPRPPEWQGFTTYFDRYPDDKLTVIVPCYLSAPAGDPAAIASAVVAECGPDLAGKKKE